MTKPLSVLIVEDSEDDASLLVRELERAGYEVSWERVDTAGAMRSALEGRSWDLVVADYAMPRFSGPAALAVLQDVGLDLPFIIVSGSVGEDIAVEVMRAGAHDYLLKGNLKRLFPAIQRELDQAGQRRDRRKAEERYRELFDSANDIVFTLDLEGRFTSINAAAERITEYPREQIVGRNFAEFVVPDHIGVVREMLRHRAAGESVASVYTMDVLARQGRRVVLEVSTRELVEGKRPVGIQGIARDITERVSLEAQLHQSQKMEAIGTLAGGVAHDFNNLLTTILGYSDLVLDQIARDSPLREDVQEIRKSAERAASLTRQLLAFSRRQLIEPAIVDLNAIVGDMDKMLRRLIGEDLELSTVMRPDLGRARVDPGQMEQVIMNLVVNARDAMPAGGRLTIETNNVDLDEEYAETHIPTLPGSYVMLAVTDTGEGMDAETRSRIFEPFFTTKPTGKGTGLGLSTVYGIVKQSGGFIWVYSEPGHGTSFKIYFPRAEEAAGSERASSLKPKNHEEAKGSETLLLVEDEEGVRKFARIVLQRAGYQVLEAKDGTEAVAVAERFEGEIHLLLSDSVMPGLTVRELIARFGALRPEASLLLMSGYTDEAIARSGLIHAGIPFVQKPFSAQDLTGRVRDVLDARRR
jgi:PAS domain S-box-containing protein